jgi:small subunit ribosomal protein S21
MEIQPILGRIGPSSLFFSAHVGELRKGAHGSKPHPLSENPGNSVSIKVQVRSNESLEAALRRFKRQCNFGGVFRMAKANTWHEKRSDERRREGRERIRTILRAARKEDPNFRKSRARR